MTPLMKMHVRALLTSAWSLLILATSVACSDEVEPVGPPTPQFQPTPVDFGRVSVTEERTLELVVSNAGGGSPYLVTSVLPPSGADQALFELGPIPSVLTERPGLPIGQTATISVTFRPCPAAIADPSNTAACPLNARTAVVQFIDNSQAENNEVVLTGLSTLPPNVGLRCGRTCNDPGNLGLCTSLSFGSVPVGESCTLPVQITNEDEGGNPVADARIESLGIDVQELVGGVSGAVISGPDAGFRIETTAGEPLTPSFSNPIVVSIGPGQTEAAYDFQVTFTPVTQAQYTGQPAQGNGFRMVFNDPADPEILANVTASATGPRFQCVQLTPFGNFEVLPGSPIQFRGVTSGETATIRIRCSNNGDAAMTLGPVSLDAGESEFSLSYEEGDAITDVVTLDPAQPGFAQRTIEITYAPIDDEPDTDTVVIECSTPACGPFEIPLAGGALPKLDLSPPSIQYDAQGGDQQCRTVTLSNVEGDAQLVVDRFEIAIAAENEESRDDFFVDVAECGPDVFDCDVDIRISAGAEDTVDVCFDNNDSSQQDTANLRVYSNDPSAVGGFREIALTARDEPCFPPEIDVGVPNRVCAGIAATLDFTPTAEKPGGLGGSGGVLGQCELRVQFGEAFAFSSNPVTVDDAWQTQFQAASTGNRIVGVTCVNDCGAETSTQLFFNVGVDANPGTPQCD